MTRIFDEDQQARFGTRAIHAGQRPDPETGYVMDLGELKRILQRAILDKCDHRNLNEQVDFLRGINPSTENLVIAFWNDSERASPASGWRWSR